MKMKFSTLIVLFCCTVTLVGQSTFDQSSSVKTATAFLATLTPTQKNVANLAFSDSSRTKWSNLPLEHLAQEKLKRVMANKNNLIFSWQGTFNTQELHYYSLKTDTFIIEFSNRDGGIQHYHTIWRDISEDFLSK